MGFIYEGLFLVFVLIVEGEFQSLAAVVADDAALFQGLFVKCDHIAANTLHLVDGGVLVAVVEAFVLEIVFVVKIVEVVLVIVVILILIVENIVLDRVQIFLDLIQLVGDGDGVGFHIGQLPGHIAQQVHDGSNQLALGLLCIQIQAIHQALQVSGLLSNIHNESP